MITLAQEEPPILLRSLLVLIASSDSLQKHKQDSGNLYE